MRGRQARNPLGDEAANGVRVDAELARYVGSRQQPRLVRHHQHLVRGIGTTPTFAPGCPRGLTFTELSAPRRTRRALGATAPRLLEALWPNHRFPEKAGDFLRLDTLTGRTPDLFTDRLSDRLRRENVRE